MGTIEEKQRAKGSRVDQQNIISAEAKKSSAGKKPPEWPEEFEEDRSMNIRMKPQPFVQPSKKRQDKKEKKGNDK